MAERKPVVLVGGQLQELPAGDALPPQAPAAHGHVTSDVSGLDAALAAKAPTGHGHAISDVSGLQGAIDAKLGVDFSGLTSAGTVDGTEVIAVNRAGTKKTTAQAILNWVLARANSWTGRQTFKDTAETVYAITDGPSVTINPANGSIQTWTLGANRTPTLTSIASGQSVTLEITAGAYTVTFTGVTWIKVGGSGTAPTLGTTGVSTVVLWKVGSVLKGCYPGST